MDPTSPQLWSSTDTALSWVKDHPYLDVDAIGHGAFGSVRKVKMLTPLGYTVRRDDKGNLLFNDKGDILLREMNEEEWGRLVGGDEVTLGGLKARVAVSGEVQWCEELNFSGLFCAWKTIATTKSLTFDCALEEIRLMEKMAQSEHVVRLYDSEAAWMGDFGKGTAQHFNTHLSVNISTHPFCRMISIFVVSCTSR